MHRSYLYVPGDRPDRIDKALTSGADAVIADLEDAVAQPNKAEARAAVAEALKGPGVRGEGAPEVFVRVNNGAELDADVRAVLESGGRSIYLPKADPESLAALARLANGEAVAVVALIETARGLLAAAETAVHPLVRNLAIGEADLIAELAMDPSAERRELIPARMSLVVASAAAGIDSPTGPVSTDFSDLDALASDTDRLRRMGFGARSAIHPAQIPVINEVFTPGQDEVMAAQRLVDLYEFHKSQGTGAFVDDSGRMVDEAVVRSARRTLARGAG
ncbi:MAG: HpcH/HpaI aldolase/citrate lyase family protein [Microthrixaceae bacterium]